MPWWRDAPGLSPSGFAEQGGDGDFEALEQAGASTLAGMPAPHQLVRGRRQALAFARPRRSAGFQTGLTCPQVAKCPPGTRRALSRFGNQRSAKDSRLRPPRAVFARSGKCIAP